VCFTVSIYATTHSIEADLGAVFEHDQEYRPYFHVSGFVHPHLPLITNAESDQIQLCEWGLIPRWTKSCESARDIRKMTLNARRETIYEKPSFRDAIRKRRALLPVNGFVEWRHEGALKIPHYVRAVDRSLLTLGCVWEDWTDPESGEVHTTFSIVTTDANELMSYVHNAKQRMPVIIPRDDRQVWLMAEDREQIEPCMRPLEDGVLEAFQVTREVSSIKVNTTEEQLLEPVGPMHT
jgi:putative SOS response-associated peptidase YedK